MKLLLTTLFAGLLLTSPDWLLNFDQAKTDARQNHKLILLNFSGSDWCGPCIKLKQNVFGDADFQQYAAGHLVLVRADFPRHAKNQLSASQTTHNEALAERYNKQGKFPFTVLLDADGRVLHEWDGYPASLTAATFVETVRAAEPTAK